MAGRAVAGRGARGIARVIGVSYSVDTDGSMDLEMSLREDAPGQPATKLARLSSRDRDPSPRSSLDRECEEFNRELEEIFGSPLQNFSSSTNQTSSFPTKRYQRRGLLRRLDPGNLGDCQDVALGDGGDELEDLGAEKDPARCNCVSLGVGFVGYVHHRGVPGAVDVS